MHHLYRWQDQYSCDGRGLYIFKVPGSSFRVRHSSEVYTVAQKDAAQLRRLYHSSEGPSLSRGSRVVLRVQRSSDRVHRSSEGYRLAQKGAAQLRGAAQLSRMQHSLVGCSVAHQGTAELRRVDPEDAMQLRKVQLSPVESYTPLAARVRARRKAFCFWNVYFLFLREQQSCNGRGGRAAPRQAC